MSFWEQCIGEPVNYTNTYETREKKVTYHPLVVEVVIIAIGALLKVIWGVVGRIAKYKDMDYLMLLDI